MENRIKRMFRAPFGSCRPRNLSDAIEKAVFIPENHKDLHMIDNQISAKLRPCPSICRTSKQVDHSNVPRQKISERYYPFISADNVDERTFLCAPASPITPLYPFYKECFGSKEREKTNMTTKMKKKKKKKKKKKNKSRAKSNNSEKNRHLGHLFSSSSLDSAYFDDWWISSDEDTDTDREDETDTLFSSSKCLSSDSSQSRRNKSRRFRSRRNTRRGEVGGVLPLDCSKVKDSFAVVKSSSDPYNDFRMSMVEMIIEKQIFAAKDLEHLLQCFLSLNSYRHHRIIVEVFTEIWDALFSDWFC